MAGNVLSLKRRCTGGYTEEVTNRDNRKINNYEKCDF